LTGRGKISFPSRTLLHGVGRRYIKAYVIFNDKLESSETVWFVMNSDNEELQKGTGQTASGIELCSLLQPEQLTNLHRYS